VRKGAPLPIYFDPKSGRHYEVDSDGTTRWVDDIPDGQVPPPPPVEPTVPMPAAEPLDPSRTQAPPAVGVERKPGWSRRKKLAVFIPLGVLALLIIAGQIGSANDKSESTGQAVPASATSTSTAPSSTAAGATGSQTTTTSATQQPSQTETTIAPAPAPKPVTYTGHGDRVLKIRKPERGHAALATITNRGGSSNFVVQDATEEQLLVNTIGQYLGTVLLDKEDGQNTTKLKVQSDGSWRITLSPISAAKQFTTKANGRRDAVVAYMGGTGTITMTHSGTENFVVTAYGRDAGETLLVNEIGRYNGQNTIEAGPLLLELNADGAWTVSVEPD
jgi:hypothetical protein